MQINKEQKLNKSKNNSIKANITKKLLKKKIKYTK